jgi:hypothetical protein
MMTESERLFESFCEGHGLTCHRVSTTIKPRPDYELEIGTQRLLVEIKQVDPNREERAFMVFLASGGKQVALGGKPGERLRRAICAANTQLKALLAGRLMPTMLVVYNNTPCHLHTQPYAVMTAMRGLDVVPVVVPSNRSELPRFGHTRSGPERAMRADANTSTSALAVLSEVDAGQFVLAVYHNRYAAAPLEPSLMRLPGVTHLRLPEGAPNSVDAQWERF